MIVHFVSNQSETGGGVPRSSRDLVGALAARGIEVELWTTDAAFVPGRHAGLAPGVHRHDGFVVRCFPLSRPRRLLRSTALIDWFGRTRQDVSAIHAHGIWFPAGSALLREARKAGIPYMLRVAGMLAAGGTRIHARKKLAYWHMVEKANVGGARALHWSCRGEPEATDPSLVDAERPGYFLPNGLPPAFEDAIATRDRAPRRARTEGTPFRVGALGRIDPIKRLDRLALAAAELRTGGTDVVVEVAGSDTERHLADLLAAVRAAGVGDSFRLLGHLELEAKMSFLESLDAFVCCSDVESFGIALLEALAMGVPSVVTTGVALARDLREAQAAIVVPPEPRAIADALGRLAADAATAEAMGRRGRAFASRYRWTAIAADVERAYAEMYWLPAASLCGINASDAHGG